MSNTFDMLARFKTIDRSQGFIPNISLCSLLNVSNGNSYELHYLGIFGKPHCIL